MYFGEDLEIINNIPSLYAFAGNLRIAEMTGQTIDFSEPFHILAFVQAAAGADDQVSGRSKCLMVPGLNDTPVVFDQAPAEKAQGPHPDLHGADGYDDMRGAAGNHEHAQAARQHPAEIDQRRGGAGVLLLLLQHEMGAGGPHGRDGHCGGHHGRRKDKRGRRACQSDHDSADGQHDKTDADDGGRVELLGYPDIQDGSQHCADGIGGKKKTEDLLAQSESLDIDIG